MLDLLAEHRRARLETLTDRLVDTIERSNPGYLATRLVPRADLRESCHDNIVRVLELLADAVAHGGTSSDAAHDPAYDAARATGSRRAEQGLPLDDVLRSYRIGGRLIWDDLVDQAQSMLDSEELREIGSRVWEVVDETSAQVALAYHAHERAAVRADEQLRAELWEGVLSGRARDPGFAHEAGRLLDLPPSGDYLVVTAATLDLGAAEAAVSAHATAWVRRSDGVVGLVALRDHSPLEALTGLERLALDPPGRPLGVSVVVQGLAGVESGFRQSSLALRTQDDRPGLASFDGRLPEALLLSSPDVAGRLIAVWLGPVLALPTSEADLLVDTLSAWVATGGSATYAAQRVHCHRNTVLNRLRRVAALTGREVFDGPPPVELELALRALWIGLPR